MMHSYDFERFAPGLLVEVDSALRLEASLRSKFLDSTKARNSFGSLASAGAAF